MCRVVCNAGWSDSNQADAIFQEEAWNPKGSFWNNQAGKLQSCPPKTCIWCFCQGKNELIVSVSATWACSPELRALLIMVRCASLDQGKPGCFSKLLFYTIPYGIQCSPLVCCANLLLDASIVDPSIRQHTKASMQCRHCIVAQLHNISSTVCHW